MDKLTQRKPKLYFDTAPSPSHVTFDDSIEVCRNIPWVNYVEARREHSKLDTIEMEIGNWLVVIIGHNLLPLYQAIANHTLTWITAHPEYKRDREREIDTFATEIRFLNPPARNLAKRRGQIEFDLGG